MCDYTMKKESVSKTSFRILKHVKENDRTSLTQVADSLDLTYPAVSRHLRGDNSYAFLDHLLDTQPNEDDARYKDISIVEGKEDEVDTLLEAYSIISQYEEEGEDEQDSQ